VVYVVVKKDSSLRALHVRVWNACLPTPASLSLTTDTEGWTPHITLAHGDEHDSIPLSRDKVRAVLGMINPKEFKWMISVDNIALVWDDGAVQSRQKLDPTVFARRLSSAP
jgi:2'-5' RNA ligase